MRTMDLSVRRLVCKSHPSVAASGVGRRSESTKQVAIRFSICSRSNWFSVHFLVAKSCKPKSVHLQVGLSCESRRFRIHAFSIQNCSLLSLISLFCCSRWCSFSLGLISFPVFVSLTQSASCCTCASDGVAF